MSNRIHYYRTDKTLCGVFDPDKKMSTDKYEEVTCGNCLRLMKESSFKDTCVYCGPDRVFEGVDLNIGIFYCKNCGIVQKK